MKFCTEQFSCYSASFLQKLNQLYEKTYKYLDKHFINEASQGCRDKLYQRIAEMMIISKLIDAEIVLSERKKNYPDVDVLIEVNADNHVWIECVTPTIGKSQDLQNFEDSLCSENAIEIPFDLLAPRVTTAVQSKIEKYRLYKRQSKVSVLPILLINLSLIPCGLNYRYRGLFEGWQDPHVYFSSDDVSSDQPTQLYVCRSENILKHDNNAIIPTNYFAQNDFPFQIVVLTEEMINSLSNYNQNILLINPKYRDIFDNDTIVQRITDALICEQDNL